MVELESHPRGVILLVRAQPGARRNAIVGEHNGQLKISVTQVAEKGKANDAVLDILCQALDLRKSQIELLSGQTSREKKFLLVDISAEHLRQRMAQVLGC